MSQSLYSIFFLLLMFSVSEISYIPTVSGTEILSAAPSIAAVIPKRRSIPSPQQSINPSYESSILIQWWLSPIFFSTYKSNLVSFYEVDYQPYGNNDNQWYAAVNVSGYDLVAPEGLREVQRIIFRSSSLGNNNEKDFIYFRLTIQDTEYSNFDREKLLITNRLPYDVSAQQLANELNRLDPIVRKYGPVHVERDTNIRDILYQWRITFNAAKDVSPVPVPLLYINEQYAPSTTSSDTAFTVDRMNSGRYSSNDKPTGCISTSPDINQNICQHYIIGLLPGNEYRFRIRAYMDNNLVSDYSLPSDKVMFPRTVADNIISSTIPTPLLSSISENSITLLIQLP